MKLDPHSMYSTILGYVLSFQCSSSGPRLNNIIANNKTDLDVNRNVFCFVFVKLHIFTSPNTYRFGDTSFYIYRLRVLLYIFNCYLFLTHTHPFSPRRYICHPQFTFLSSTVYISSLVGQCKNIFTKKKIIFSFNYHLKLIPFSISHSITHTYDMLYKVLFTFKCVNKNIKKIGKAFTWIALHSEIIKQNEKYLEFNYWCRQTTETNFEHTFLLW